ncbi:Fructosamine kinase-domain-containing protein [Peziza echinospora]|nr:Fructosamine kinase-domain-containing protein [Peziza echinospora]
MGLSSLVTTLTKLDSAIAKVLPSELVFREIKKHGLSLWTSTFKVEMTSPHGCTVAYFLKCSKGEKGKTMMQGEFEASSAIYAISPDFCPRPIAAGKFADMADTHFYICEFIEMTEDAPPTDITSFCSKIAQLHKSSTSPNGKFGFHVTTCNGWIPQKNDWQTSWTKFFKDGFVYLLEMDRRNNGPEATSILEPHKHTFVDVVIPRLLLPLETDGNTITPSLVHGDLWFGNTATTADRRNQPMIFDPAAFYAHNEYELGNWRPVRNRFQKAHFREYRKFVEVSQPEEEFDDRNLLYSIRFNLHAAILFPDTPKYREFVATDMATLIEKYGESEFLN